MIRDERKVYRKPIRLAKFRRHVSRAAVMATVESARGRAFRMAQSSHWAYSFSATICVVCTEMQMENLHFGTSLP